MIRALLRDDDGIISLNYEIDMLSLALENPEHLLWLDISHEPLEIIEPILTKYFHFHPLAVEDALQETHVPKVDDWQTYLYVVLRAAVIEANDEVEVQMPELDVFLGANYLVTYAWEPVTVVDRVWRLCGIDERWLTRGPDFLLYRLTDEMAGEAVEIVELMQINLDALEEKIFGGAAPDTLEELFTLKRNTLKMRRIAAPQRDVLQKLSRNPYEVIKKEDRVFFRDVYDHLVSLNEKLDELLILVGSALDTYLSVVNNRMNDIMKTLTIITAFFMPLTFITGFFGMNFFHAGEALGLWTGRLAFVLSMAVMICVPGLMFFWMRRRTWV